MNTNRYPQQYTASNEDHPQSNRSFRSGTPHPTFHPREPSIMAMLAPSQTASRVQLRQGDEKEMSVRSFNTTKTTSRVSYRPIFEPQQYDPHDDPRAEVDSRSYDAIERILKNQNQNLKNQNELLLREVHKLKKNNYNYKQQYKQARIDLEQAREQCEAQKKRADEMKEIIMNRLAQLEGKFNIEEGNSHFAIEECESILEALTFSESEIR